VAVARPTVDVVVPFRGAPAELAGLRESLGRLRLSSGDTIVVVDNTPGPGPQDGIGHAAVPVLYAPEVSAPGYARNRGAARGSAEWLVFLDADAVPSPDLLDRYLGSEPGERTALLAGGVLDEPVAPGGSRVARYSHIQGSMSQDIMMGRGEWAFPMSTNVACRRAAFEAAGGFREDIRAAEDADLTYRLRASGWAIERREEASVVHRNRQTLRGFVAQKLTWGAGAEWIDREYPGATPAQRWPGLVRWALRRAAVGLATARRSRDRDAALLALLEPLEQLCFRAGRHLPNERPLPQRSPWRLLSPAEARRYRGGA